jgi:hypothetical protein
MPTAPAPMAARPATSPPVKGNEEPEDSVGLAATGVVPGSVVVGESTPPPLGFVVPGSVFRGDTTTLPPPYGSVCADAIEGATSTSVVPPISTKAARIRRVAELPRMIACLPWPGGRPFAFALMPRSWHVSVASPITERERSGGMMTSSRDFVAL